MKSKIEWKMSMCVERRLVRVNSQIHGDALQFTVKSMEQSSKLQSKTINEETLL
jgi:hypothetical protein